MRLLSKSLPLLQSGLFRGLGAASQLALAWWVSKSLAKAEAGEFLFYLSCFTVLSPVLLFGTQQYAMRQLSQFDEVDATAGRTAYELMRLNLRVILWVSVLALPLAVLWDNRLFASSPKQGFDGEATWLVLCSVLTGVALVVAAHFHGIRRLGSSIFFSHICLPAVTVAAFSLFPPLNALHAIRCHVGAAIVTLVAALLCWRYVFRAGRTKSLSETDQTAVIEARPFSVCRDFWLLNAFQLVMNWSPLIVAGFLLAGEELAELNVAQRAANLINFLLVVVSFAFTPKFRLYWTRNDLPGLRNVINKCSVYLFVIGTPVALGVILGSPWIMTAFGEGYRNGAILLCVFAAGQYFNVITGSVNQILTMCNHERTLRNICFVSAFLSLTLGSYLVLQYGPIGAAIGVAVALTVQNILAVLAVKKLLGFWVFQWRISQITDS